MSGGPSSASRSVVAGGVSSPAGDLDEFFTGGVDSVPDAPADELLQRITAFLTKHNQQLNDMRETLSDTTTEAWNEENFIVKIDMVRTSSGPPRTRHHLPLSDSCHVRTH